MHRSWFAAALLSSALAFGCGGTSSSPQEDASVQSDGAGDGAAGQQDGSQAGDGPNQNDAAQSDGGAPASHTEDNGGVMHLPGKEDPKVNCVACHGANLTGGTGPSCYGCHTTADHTVNRGGHLHRSGSQSTCVPCHGPFSSTTGALAKGCNSAGCH